MRSARAAVPYLVAALALPGCMGRTAPAAGARRSGLDALASAYHLVPLGASLSPGDAVLIGKRWF